jgi:hypothetical protein
MRSEVKFHPLCPETYPKVCRVTNAQKNASFCKMTVIHKSSNLQSLIGESDKDLFHSLTELLVQTKAMTLLLAGQNFVIAGDEGGYCEFWKLQTHQTFYQGDEMNKIALSGSFRQPQLATVVGLCNLKFESALLLRVYI